MTWDAGIGAAIGLIALVMILASQHGIGTSAQHDDPPDGDPK